MCPESCLSGSVLVTCSLFCFLSHDGASPREIIVLPRRSAVRSRWCSVLLARRMPVQDQGDRRVEGRFRQLVDQESVVARDGVLLFVGVAAGRNSALKTG